MLTYKIQSMRFDAETGRNMVNIGMMEVLLVTWLIDCVQIVAKHQPAEFAMIAADYLREVLEAHQFNLANGGK